MFQKKYLSLLTDILNNGYTYEDPNRPGIKRKELSTATITHDLSKGFPLLNVKPIHIKSVYYELLWFLNGYTDAKLLNDKGVKIWNPDSKNNNGNLGPIYGKQWTAWEGKNYVGVTKTINQIENVINQLQENPMSSSLVVSAWNPAQLKEMALPPCHYSFQLSCEPGNHINLINKMEMKINLTFNMRSVDTLLGLPFNMMSYSLLLELICMYLYYNDNTCYYIPGTITFNGTKVHLYEPHFKAAIECIMRGFDKPIDGQNHKLYYNNDLLADMLDKQGFSNITFSEFAKLLWENHPIIKFPYYKPMGKLQNNCKMLPYGK